MLSLETSFDHLFCRRQTQLHLGALARDGGDGDAVPQFAQHPSAEIESDAGGFFLLPSVVSGEPLFENTGQILRTDADACVLDGQGLGGVRPGDGDVPLLRRPATSRR